MFTYRWIYTIINKFSDIDMGPDIYTRTEILNDKQLETMHTDALQQRVLYEDDLVTIQLATSLYDITLETCPEFCFNGSFGLIMTHNESKERLAVSGFDIRDRNGQHELLVEHLAQG